MSPLSTIVDAAAQRRDLQLVTDVVVVGSGAGGAVVAAELAEAGQRVVVLEEGSNYTPEWFAKSRPSLTMRHVFRDGGFTFALGLRDTPMINITMGRCIGGSSAITGGVCFRTPGHILRRWSHEMGLGELTEERLDPCFNAVEEAIHVEEVPVEMRSRSTAMFADGAVKLGHPLKPTRRNTRDCHGCGHCNFGCPHQARLSVDMTYLPRALQAGAQIYAGCKVQRILRDGHRASGVSGHVVSPDGRVGRLTVRAKRVVIAAGSYCSPVLLQQSGLGRRSGQVGRNVTLHPGFRVMAATDEPIRGWRGAMQSAYSDAFEQEHITLMSLFLPAGVLAATMEGAGPEHLKNAKQIPHLAVFGGMIHDEAGGTIRGRGDHIFATYQMSRADRARLPRLIRIMANTFFAGGAKRVFLPILGMSPVTADELASLDLERIPGKRLECSSQHPLGSCRMGTNPDTSVVDPDGQSWELEDLYLADGSVVPSSLGVNPQVTIMAMATRIAWKLRDKPLR